MVQTRQYTDVFDRRVAGKLLKRGITEMWQPAQLGGFLIRYIKDRGGWLDLGLVIPEVKSPQVLTALTLIDRNGAYVSGPTSFSSRLP